MISPHDIEIKLGFDTVRSDIVARCSSRMGKDAAEAMTFSFDYSDILCRLRQTDEMLSMIRNGGDLPGESVFDVIPYLTEIKAYGSFMTAERLHSLGRMLHSIAEVRNFFSKDSENGAAPLYPELKRRFEDVAVFPSIETEIDRCVNKYGEIKDNASSELAEIRRSSSSANGSIARAMRRVLERAAEQGIVEKDTTPAMRDGRMVLPVSAALKKKLSLITISEPTRRS